MTRKISRRSMIVAGAAAGAAGAAGVLVRPAFAGDERASKPGGYALTHVTVIDPHSGKVLPDTTVIVRGDRITDVGTVRVPAGTKIVDLRGKYVIPGLADMHAHAQGEGIDTALWVANGVTTVREMSGSVLSKDWRTRIDAGTLLGPRYTISSRVVDGNPSIWDPAYLDIVQVTDAAQARAAVRKEAAEGADFIKVYSRVPREAYRALAAEAHRLGVPFAGHCPDNVPVAEAADLGHASIEHMFWTAFDTSREETQIREEVARLRLELGDYSAWFQAIHRVEWRAMHSHSPAKAREVYGRFARRRTRQVPTLAMHYGLNFAREIDVDADPRKKYLPEYALMSQRLAQSEFYLKDRPVAEDPEWAAKFEFQLRTVGDMHRAGVPIMTGTDTGTCAVYPGFSVHDELGLLVRAGLSPMDALHASTAEPARFLGAETGRVAPRHAADLVILDANPLDDIANTKRLSGVVVRGRYIDETERQAILAEVERVAATAPAGVATPCPCHAPIR